MIRRFLQLVALLILAAIPASAQITASGNALLPSGAAPANGKVCFSLQNFRPNIPRVTGTGTIVSTTTFCVPVNTSTGSYSTNLYGNDVITAGTQTGGTRWRVEFYVGGILQSAATYNVTGASYNFNTASPDTTALIPAPGVQAVITNPSGSQTIAQPAGTQLEVDDFCTSNSPNVDVRCHGAKPDAKNNTNFTSTSGLAVLNATNAPWLSTDIGKSMRIRRFDTGAVIFKGTVLSFQSTNQITLSGNVSYTCAAAGCIAVWGTDNATALQAALTAAANLTTGVTLADLVGQESNYPLKLGSVKVTFPADSRGSMYLFGTQLTVARKVDIDAQAMLFSNVGDGTANDRTWAISGSPGAHITRLELDASNGMGVTIGTALTQSHTFIGALWVWNAGTNSNGALSPVDQTAIQLLGFDWRVGLLWSKGGSIGTKLNISDYHIDFIYPIGAVNNGLYFDGSLGRVDNVNIDSVSGNGVFINSGSDFNFPNVQAFGNLTTLGSVVNVNAMSFATINIHARNTGGKVLTLKGTKDSTITFDASLTFFSWETQRLITELVEYSTGNSGVINISGRYDSAIASISSGTRVGTLDIESESSATRFLAATGGIYKIKAKSNATNAATLELYNETTGFYWHIPVRANTADALQFYGNNGGFNLALELGIAGTQNKSVALAPFSSGLALGTVALPWAGTFTTGAFSGQIASTLVTGTAPFSIASTTNVANLNASSLNGATFAAPGAIGGGTPASGAFTTGSFTGQVTSTLATGTAPLSIASTTKVANLNVDKLDDADWAAPAALGSTTPAAITGTTVTANTSLTVGTGLAITDIFSAIATLDFPNTLASTCSDLTITVTEAKSGDAVSLGIANASIPAGGTFFGWVSATNTVTVRFCADGTARDPASGSFRATVIAY